uniref:GRIP domain-containing protein n=1 Tax=Arion vulgaris TaxID=1028688 RepID=A0A0B7B5D4_9EUPU
MTNFHHQEEVAELQAKIDNLSKAVLAQEDKFKQEVAHIKCDHQKEIHDLELEFKKQRDRTVAMLAEKDAELLQRMSGHSLDLHVFQHWNHHAVDHIPEGSDDKRSSSEELEAVNRLLELPKGIQNEATFLHFAEERGRLKVDILGLRRQKRHLETALRDLQFSTSQKEEQLKDEVNALSEQIAQCERHSVRGAANVEYLKNVLLKFLTSMDSVGKQQMLKALMTILQFSPQEREQVMLVQVKGWWPT